MDITLEKKLAGFKQIALEKVFIKILEDSSLKFLILARKHSFDDNRKEGFNCGF